jgi:non-specific serine/threonine protein kinase
MVLENLADASYRLGELEDAVTLAEEAVAAGRASGDRALVAIGLVSVAGVARERGELDWAAACLRESLDIATQLGYHAGIADALVGWSGVAAASRQTAVAARLLGAAIAIREAIGANRFLHDAHYRRVRETVAAAMTSAAYEAAIHQGRMLQREEAVSLALAVRPEAPEIITNRPDVSLTHRELEVLQLVSEGKSNRQIAEALYLSHRTVGVHITNMLSKIGVPSRTAAVAFARSRNLLPS